MGMDYCGAPFCKNDSKTSGMSFFRFPKEDGPRYRQWMAAVDRPELRNKPPLYVHNNIKLCVLHFEDHMFYDADKDDARLRLLPTAVPTLFIWEDELRAKLLQMDAAMLAREEELKKRKGVRDDDEEAQEDLKEIRAWRASLAAVDRHGFRSRRVCQFIYKFVRDMGMRPKKRPEEVSFDRQVSQLMQSQEGDGGGAGRGMRQRKAVKREPEDEEHYPIVRREVKKRVKRVKKTMPVSPSETPSEIDDGEDVNGASVDAEETFLYDSTLLSAISFSHLTCFNPAVESPAQAGQGLLVRPLSCQDFQRGYVKLLGQLSRTDGIGQEEFMERFYFMKGQTRTYYVTVIEDVLTERIVGAATLIREVKFLRNCAARGLIEDVVVSDEYRGKQLGKIILATKVEMARKMGCCKVTLTCSDTLAKFYSVLGFRADSVSANNLTLQLSE